LKGRGQGGFAKGGYISNQGFGVHEDLIFYLKVGATRGASACAARAIPSFDIRNSLFDIRYFTLYHLTIIRDKQVKKIVLLPDYLI
jgi:hypothetical protein